MQDVNFYFAGKVVFLPFKTDDYMKYFYAAGIVFLILTSCENVSYSPLIGKWQLKTVNKNGETFPVDTVWYNFHSISIFAIQIYQPRYDSYVLFEGMRKQDDNVISIEMIHETAIYYCDWDNPSRSFTIEKLNRKQLLLRSEEGFLYSFIKF